jgi:tyrosyl-DNA phosphodiesterase 2
MSKSNISTASDIASAPPAISSPVSGESWSTSGTPAYKGPFVFASPYTDLKFSNTDLKSSNRDLESSNTDLESSNTDLQSPNTDLQSSNTDLPSSNTDLKSSNTDLKSSNTDLKSSNTDLQSLNASKVWMPFPDYSTSSAMPLPRSTSFTIISWNIDFVADFSGERMRAALTHLSTLLPSAPKHTILLFQEVENPAQEALLEHEWVREHFLVSDMTPKRDRYYTLSLATKDVPIATVSRHRYPRTNMGRDVLILDIPLEGGGCFRVANTHLESLPHPGVEIRPQQMAVVARFLKEEGVVAGLVAGDMNCIRPEDEELARGCGLGDVWNVKKEMAGGMVDESEGFTWGYQPPCEFPPGRLDRVFFCGDIRLESIEEETILRKVGVGLRFQEPVFNGGSGSEDGDDGWVSDGSEGEDEMAWVSDHYGLWVQATAGGTI